MVAERFGHLPPRATLRGVGYCRREGSFPEKRFVRKVTCRLQAAASCKSASDPHRLSGRAGANIAGAVPLVLWRRRVKDAGALRFVVLQQRAWVGRTLVAMRLRLRLRLLLATHDGHGSRKNDSDTQKAAPGRHGARAASWSPE